MRTLIDIILYKLSLKMGRTIIVIIEISLFLFSLLIFFIELKKNSINGINQYIIFTLVISFLSIAYTILKFLIQRHRKKHVYIKASLKNKIDIENILPSTKEEQSDFKKVVINIKGNDDATIYSNTINSILINREFKIKISNEYTKQVRDKIKQNYNVLIPFLDFNSFNSIHNDKTFINEKKLCLTSDINIDKETIICHKGKYFDSVLTNESFGKIIKSGENLNVSIADAIDLFPLENNNNSLRIKDLTTSLANNHIGVSTLAITEDNYILLWVQNKKAQQSAELIAPTGSGSVDFKDFDKMNNSFIKSICNAMERELTEENKLNNKYLSMRTQCLGFFRWISRAGKPEFVGITKLNLPFASFAANREEVSHVAFVEYISNVDSIPSVISKIEKLNNLSIPVIMNLKFLRDFYLTKTGKTMLEEMLR